MAPPAESGEVVQQQAVTGVLEVVDGRGGFLRDPNRSFQPTRADVFVSRDLIQRMDLVTGSRIAGTAQTTRHGTQLTSIESVCGLPPEVFRRRTPYTSQIAVNPDRRFRIGSTGNPSMRVIDLFAPIARGTRGLIVAPPKTGKTIILEELTKAIHADDPAARILVMLINERPEEVTHFRRSVPAEVMASSSDQAVEDHVRVAGMVMAEAACEFECGRDVVVMVDSLTRLGRAYNQHGAGSGRTMSGGLDSRALEIPRQFFGMARNAEGGGSITVIATALIETGSRMDDMIFEEFKGTGNMEILLDRTLAEARVFPAINLVGTGTRREELLYSQDDLIAINKLRRRAHAVGPQQAIEGLLAIFEKWPTNEALLKALE